MVITQQTVGTAIQRFQPGNAPCTVPRHPVDEGSEQERSCQGLNYGMIRVWHPALLLDVRNGVEASLVAWSSWKKELPCLPQEETAPP